MIAAFMVGLIALTGQSDRGPTLPAACVPGELFIRTSQTPTLHICTATDTWSAIGGSSAPAIPSGAILLVDSGTCPAGFTEVAALAGKTLLGTTVAAANVGSMGGADTVTPSGSNSAPVLTMNSLTPSGTVTAPSLTMNSYTPAGTTSGTAVSAHTGANVTSVFTGTALATHAHELPFQIPSTTTTRQLAVATFGTGTARAATAVSANGTANTTSAAVALSQAISAGTPAGTIANTVTQAANHTATNPTFAGTPATLTGTISAPSFTGGQVTPTGSVAAPTFTGQAFDNRSAFTRVIFCRAN